MELYEVTILEHLGLHRATCLGPHCALDALLGGKVHHALDRDFAQSVVVSADAGNACADVVKLRVRQRLELGHDRRHPSV